MTKKENAIKDFMNNMSKLTPAENMYDTMIYMSDMRILIEKLYVDGYNEGYQDGVNIKIDQP